jgi:dTDP-4-amino-4,6-dideoxygalactose transaminase
MTASVPSAAPEPQAAPPLAIPFNRASVGAAELALMARAVENGFLSGDGPFTRECRALLEQVVGVPRALLTTSCTHALEMAALLLDLEPGDEVIVPSFTFVSSINAFALRGAQPVFADIRPDTLNIDDEQLPSLVTPRTRAIVVVHYAGVGCDMDRIGALAAERGLAIVEDNAHGLFGSYRGRRLGTFGRFAAQSFHETKNLSCGEGGALLVNDPADVERAEIIREKGTDRSRFLRGQVDKYTWTDLGSSYLPSDILAACLLAQLQARDAIQAARRARWERYDRELADWAEEHGVRRPAVPPECDQSYHMYYMLMPSLEARTALIRHLRTRGIQAAFHYQPLHLSPMGLRYGGARYHCPVTEHAADHLVRLPLYQTLSEADQALVIDAVRAAPAADA